MFQDLFVHPTFLDRVASMLNYFLKKLVGNERNNLAVRTRYKEIEFKPKKLVKDICYIFINLSSTYKEEIAGAIARDGRSYSGYKKNFSLMIWKQYIQLWRHFIINTELTIHGLSAACFYWLCNSKV